MNIQIFFIQHPAQIFLENAIKLSELRLIHHISFSLVCKPFLAAAMISLHCLCLPSFHFSLVPFDPIHSLPLWHMEGVVGKVDNGGDRV